MGRAAHLSEEDERQLRDDRDQLRSLDRRLAALDDRRKERYHELDRLESEQRALFERQRPLQRELEGLYREHRDLGHELGQYRGARDKARERLNALVGDLRMSRPVRARAPRIGPEQIAREVAALEHRQQTNALPLAEENALIDRLRELSRQLKDAQGVEANEKAEVERLKTAEAKVAQARQELAQISQEFDRMRAERDHRMVLMRERLAEVGALLAEMRRKAGERRAVMAQLDDLGRSTRELEREGNRILARSRAREHEARRVARVYAPRPTEREERARQQRAEDQLEELLKRGRVTLTG